MGRGLKTIVVMGMHRSATSMAARALHNSGEVWMGHELLTDYFHGSADGLYEHAPVGNLNQEILKAAGGDWNDPPSRDRILEVGPDFTAKIKSVTKDLEQGARDRGFGSVGFKDPRLCLTVELFAPHLSQPQYLTLFRDHRQIAQSLFNRDGMPLDQGVALSLEYSRRAITFLARTYGS